MEKLNAIIIFLFSALIFVIPGRVLAQDNPELAAARARCEAMRAGRTRTRCLENLERRQRPAPVATPALTEVARCQAMRPGRGQTRCFENERRTRRREGYARQGSTTFTDAVNSTVNVAFNCNSSSPNQCPQFPNERLEEFTGSRILAQVPFQTCMAKEEFRSGDLFRGQSASELDSLFNDNDILNNGGEIRLFGETCLGRENTNTRSLEAIQRQFTNVSEEIAASRENCESINHRRRRTQCMAAARRRERTEFENLLPVAEPQIEVADTYLSHLKLRTAIEESMRSVNLIGLLTDPDKNMDPVTCEDTPYPQTAVLCNNLKNDRCNQKRRAAQMRADHLSLTKKSLLQVRALKLRKQELQREIAASYTGGLGPDARQRNPEKVREMASIDEKMALYTSQAPWIAGDKFKDVLDFSNTSRWSDVDRLFREGGEDEFDNLVAQAFDAQMKDNEKNLSDQIKEFNSAGKCLRGAGICDLDDTNAIVERTPEIDISSLDVPNKEHLQFAQCLQEETKEANEQADLIREIGIGVGLTVASIFVPPLGIARVAQLGATAIRGVGTVARLRAAGQLGSTAAVGAGDLFYASESFSEAYNQCTEDQTSEVSFSDTVAPSNGSFSCDVENDKLAARVEHIPTECFSSILFAGIDAIPFAAFATSQALRTARNARRADDGPSGSGVARATDGDGSPNGGGPSTTTPSGAGASRTPSSISFNSTPRGAGQPQTYSQVTSSVGNVDTSEELLRFKAGFNDDVLRPLGLDELQNYDNPAEIQAYRDVLQHFLEPGEGIVVDGALNPNFIEQVNNARRVRGLDPIDVNTLSDQDRNGLLELGRRWDGERNRFGAERVRLADLRSQALKNELRAMDLPEESIRDVNCEKLARLSPGFSTRGNACFGFRTGDPQPENMRGKFCSCGSRNAATNWLIRCPQNQGEFLRATNYYDQLGLFKNESLNCFRVSIPNNTTCFAGAAGPRRGGLGGMSQIFCPNRIQGDFGVNWEGMSPQEITEKIAASRALWDDLGVPQDWVLRSPDPAAVATNNRADAVGESFRNYMIDWSPNPQNPGMARWVDTARNCVKQAGGGRPCDVAEMSDDFEDVLRNYADYNPSNRENPWTLRENSPVSQEEFDSFRNYTCQYLFQMRSGECAGPQFINLSPNAVRFSSN